MALFEKPAISYAENVKVGGVFGKKYPVTVELYKERMAGRAFREITGQNGRDFIHVTYDIPYDKVASISLERISSRDGIVIEYKYDTLALYNSTAKNKIVLWGLEDPQIVKMDIERACRSFVDERSRLLAEKKEKERLHEEAALTFYRECYDFHVKAETPVYTFQSGKNDIVALYIAEDKSLNFMQINGYRREENVGTIPYDNIHYYEKAGNVSYATDVHGKYSSYGGSFTGASFSKGAAALGGLFCGYMGMIAGALYSHTPAQMTSGHSHFSLDSKIVKIDDRNIILNYYSIEKKQYMDIELPQDIYNFLQTHLPEKKYGIVEEIERQAAVRKSQGALEAGGGLHLASAGPTAGIAAVAEEPTAAFKAKVEKLKLMKDAGFLSDEEFDEERRKLLTQL